MYIQGVDNVYDLAWNSEGIKYGDVFLQNEKEQSTYNFEKSNPTILIKNFEELIRLCNEKKELKLKYELETNVSLVSFVENRIEISFNENLDKNFVKELSLKLYDWTGKRWIITISKEVGQLSKKNKKNLEKSNLIKVVKEEDAYKKILETFPDAELIDVKMEEDEK